jgi:hypothetical protein
MIPGGGEEKEEELVPYNSGNVEDGTTNNPTVSYSSSWTAGCWQESRLRLPAEKLIGIVPQGTTGGQFQCRIINARG